MLIHEVSEVEIKAGHGNSTTLCGHVNVAPQRQNMNNHQSKDYIYVIMCISICHMFLDVFDANFTFKVDGQLCFNYVTENLNFSITATHVI